MSTHSAADAAVSAFERGYRPVPIRSGKKHPTVLGWQNLQWDTPEEVREAFNTFADDDHSGVGLMLGKPSNGLVDVDIDHPKAVRLRDGLLPPTAMTTGRSGRPKTHLWYQVDWDPDPNSVDNPQTRRYTLEDHETVSVELRADGCQTVIPPSVHPSGEVYRWEGEPWGGTQGPTKIAGRSLAIQVALVGMGAVLLENWPKRGSRHEAYLALAGGLLRLQDGIHPYWQRNLPVLIHELAFATDDDDGPQARVNEIMGTTLRRLEGGGKAVGFTRLGEIIGPEAAIKAQRIARNEIEELAGRQWLASSPKPKAQSKRNWEPDDDDLEDDFEDDGEDEETDDFSDGIRNPMEERLTSWSHVDLDPYLAGDIEHPPAEILVREDGQGLFYRGKVNTLFGRSESGKSWAAALACLQEMNIDNRVVYVDLEDDPIGTLKRMIQIGATHDDLRNKFRYVHPEGPLSPMEVGRFGPTSSAEGERSQEAFSALLATFNPTLVVVDGMTSLYGLHNHSTNDASGTDVITRWLKSLTNFGKTAVITIDHTGKSGGSEPLGSQHKKAMVQGSMIVADKINQIRKGDIGLVELKIEKDRIGSLREITKKNMTTIALMEVDSRVENEVKITLKPPKTSEVTVGASTPNASEEDILEQMNQESVAREHLNYVLRLIKSQPAPISRLELMEILSKRNKDISETTIKRVITRLHKTEKITKAGSGRGTKYYVKPQSS